MLFVPESLQIVGVSFPFFDRSDHGLQAFQKERIGFSGGLLAEDPPD